MSEAVHLHPNRLNRNHNIFLLFLPAIIFALVIAFIVFSNPSPQISTTSQPSTLGEETEKLDNQELLR